MRGARVAVGSLALVAVVAASCRDTSDSPERSDAGGTTTTEAAPAAVPGDEWAVDDPADHGIDAARLDEARAYAFAEGRNTQGVVVVHAGAIVAEWYAEGADAESPAASWSVAKSFTSALIGIAIDDGLIAGVDEPMATWYPEWAADGRAAITLGDVLQMSSGLDWVEDYTSPDPATNDIVGLVLGSPDELAYAAAQPLRSEPGSVFNYSSGDSMLLSGVLEQATGMSAADFAQEVLFDPIGMDPVDWWQDAAGHTLTYCCLDTTTRDFARFGQLYLEDGRWGDQQVVPAAWVAESRTPSPAFPGYGYQWWLSPGSDRFSALGFDTQRIFVVPEHDLVVVRNGTYVKHDGPSIADPNLFTYYPSAGLAPGRGTSPPDDWSDEEFLGLVVAAVTAAS